MSEEKVLVDDELFNLAEQIERVSSKARDADYLSETKSLIVRTKLNDAFRIILSAMETLNDTEGD